MRNIHKKNRAKLLKLMKNKSMLLVASSPRMWRNGSNYYPYRQDSDFYYLTGIQQFDSVLIIYKISETKTGTLLFIHKPTEREIIYNSNFLNFDNTSEISDISDVFYLDDIKKEIKKILPEINQFYYCFKHFKASNNKLITNQTRYIKKYYPTVKFENADTLLMNLRIIKEPEEVEYTKKALEITKNALIDIFSYLKKGTSEREIFARLNLNYTKLINSSYAFDPIVATGINACVLHYDACKSFIGENDLFLIDTGAEYLNYASDITRTFPVNRKFSDKQEYLYQAILDIQKELIKFYVPGFSINKINEKTNQLMEDLLLYIGLITKTEIKNQAKNNPVFKKYYPHSVTHFLGLDVHDVGEENTILKKGMILTCEPGLYVPEWELGIRIEDDILITDSEPEILSDMIPKEINDVENWIK